MSLKVVLGENGIGFDGIGFADVTNKVVAFMASECREIEIDGDMPNDYGESYRNEVVVHLESLGATGIEIATVGYNSDAQSDAFGTMSHVVAFLPPSSVDLETLKSNLMTNSMKERTGFYCVALEAPSTEMKVAA